MALSASIEFGEFSTNNVFKSTHSYPILQCRCHFGRSHNGVFPESMAHCDRIEITLKAPQKEDLTLYEWFINNTSFNGRIIFDLGNPSINSDTHTKTILFTDAICFSLKESYRIDKLRHLTMEFCAKTVDANSFVFNHL